MICQFNSMYLIEETLKGIKTREVFFNAKIKNLVRFNGRGEEVILPLTLLLQLFEFY